MMAFLTTAYFIHLKNSNIGSSLVCVFIVAGFDFAGGYGRLVLNNPDPYAAFGKL